MKGSVVIPRWEHPKLSRHTTLPIFTKPNAGAYVHANSVCLEMLHQIGEVVFAVEFDLEHAAFFRSAHVNFAAEIFPERKLRFLIILHLA